MIACSRPSVSGSVRRAAGERGKSEEGLGREDGARAPSLPLSHLESIDFSLAAVFVSLNRLIFRSPLFSFASTN